MKIVQAEKNESTVEVLNIVLEGVSILNVTRLPYLN